MSQTTTLTKVLHIREREKDHAQKAYNRSIELFEEVATKFYALLKKKEEAEASYENYLQSTVQIEKIVGQMAYIETLNNQIVDLQQQVNQARDQMEAKQQTLTDSHIEVKKFEKLIEARKWEHHKEQLKQEQASMDEISVQQFLSQRQGGNYGKEIGS